MPFTFQLRLQVSKVFAVTVVMRTCILFCCVCLQSVRVSSGTDLKKKKEEEKEKQLICICACMIKHHMSLSNEVLDVHLHSFNREGWWGTTEDFRNSFLHFSVLHCPLGLGELQACPFLDIVFFLSLFLCLPCLLFCRTLKKNLQTTE